MHAQDNQDQDSEGLIVTFLSILNASPPSKPTRKHAPDQSRMCPHVERHRGVLLVRFTRYP